MPPSSPEEAEAAAASGSSWEAAAAAAERVVVVVGVVAAGDVVVVAAVAKGRRPCRQRVVVFVGVDVDLDAMAAVVVVEQSTSAVEVLVESGGHVARGAQVELCVLARNSDRCLHHLVDVRLVEGDDVVVEYIRFA